MLRAYTGATFDALRNAMPLKVFSGTTFDAERNPDVLAPLFPSETILSVVDKNKPSAQFSMTFPEFNPALFVPPKRVIFTVFGPDAEVPVDPNEMIAKCLVSGEYAVPALAADAGNKVQLAPAVVEVSTAALLPPGKAVLKGCKVVSIIDVDDQFA